MPSLFIITGLHRSGTTYVGEMLRQAGITVVHEPLNEQYGVCSVPAAYPFVNDARGEFASLVDRIISFNISWNRSKVVLRKCRRCDGIIYWTMGGRSYWLWNVLKIRHRLRLLPQQICWKDPFVSLATPYLINQHCAKVVLMVRHPAAIYYSTKKQSWCFDIENLQRQSELITQYGHDIPQEHWDLARKHHVASIALLWRMMIKVNKPLVGTDLLMVKHEDLCMQPELITRQIFGHFGVPFSDIIQAFVVSNSEGANPESLNGRVHDFKRDSKSLPDVWRKHISQEELDIIRVVGGQEFYEIYGVI